MRRWAPGICLLLSLSLLWYMDSHLRLYCSEALERMDGTEYPDPS